MSEAHKWPRMTKQPTSRSENTFVKICMFLLWSPQFFLTLRLKLVPVFTLAQRYCLGFRACEPPTSPPPGAAALIFPSLDFLPTSHRSDWGSQKTRWDAEAESSEASTALLRAARKQRRARDRALLFPRDPRWARGAFLSLVFRG